MKLLPMACAVLVTVFAARAQAFERQWHAGVDAGYATLFVDEGSGFGGGAHLAYGLSDAFNAMVELDLTRHPSAHYTFDDGAGGPTTSREVTTVWSGAVGAAYTLDVTQWVPYAGLLAAAYHLTGDEAKTAPGFQIALGLDY